MSTEKQMSEKRNETDLLAPIPIYLILNDQGGGVMSTDSNVTMTLRAQEHGHQPIVCIALDAIYTTDKLPEIQPLPLMPTAVQVPIMQGHP